MKNMCKENYNRTFEEFAGKFFFRLFVPQGGMTGRIIYAVGQKEGL